MIWQQQPCWGGGWVWQQWQQWHLTCWLHEQLVWQLLSSELEAGEQLRMQPHQTAAVLHAGANAVALERVDRAAILVAAAAAAAGFVTCADDLPAAGAVRPAPAVSAASAAPAGPLVAAGVLPAAAAVHSWVAASPAAAAAAGAQLGQQSQLARRWHTLPHIQLLLGQTAALLQKPCHSLADASCQQLLLLCLLQDTATPAAAAAADPLGALWRSTVQTARLVLGQLLLPRAHPNQRHHRQHHQTRHGLHKYAAARQDDSSMATKGPGGQFTCSCCCHTDLFSLHSVEQHKQLHGTAQGMSEWVPVCTPAHMHIHRQPTSNTLYFFCVSNSTP
jgi:hypothetical protein